MAEVQVTNGNFKIKMSMVWKVIVFVFLSGGFYYKVESLETKQIEAEKKIESLSRIESDINLMKWKIDYIYKKMAEEEKK